MANRKLRLISLCLTLLWLLSLPALAAGTKELLVNGDFEELDDSGMPTGFSVSGDWEITNERPRSGENAVRLCGEQAGMISITLEGLLEGETYTLSGFAKGDVNANAAFTVQFSYYNQNDKIKYLPSSVYKTGLQIDKTRYTEQSVSFVSPAGAQRAQLMFRKVKAGEVFWDKVSFQGVLGEPRATKAPDPLPPMPAQGAATPAADTPPVENDRLENGSFEALDENGQLAAWGTSAVYGEHIEVYTEAPHGGKNGVWLYGDEHLALSQGVGKIVPGEEYVLSAFMKCSKGASPAMKVEWSGYDENNTWFIDGGLNKYYPEADKWTKIELPITAPANVSNATIMLRLLGEGSVYFDDVSFTGPEGEEKELAPILLDLPEKVAGTEELVENGGFEEVTGSAADGWSVYKGEWENNKYVSLDTDKVYAGKYSLKIKTKESGYPWVRTMVRDLLPGVKYMVSAMVNSNDLAGSGIAFKYEFYSGDEISADTGVKQTVGQYQGITHGGWVQMMDTFTVPAGAKSLALYARLYGTGCVYFDEISLVQIEPVQTLQLYTDKVFYYAGEQKTGTAHIVPSAFYDGFEGHVRFTLSDGDTVLLSGEADTVGGAAQFDYPLALLTEKGHDYSLHAEVLDASGSVYRTFSQYVYVYDRPEKLRRDGVYTDENGKPFTPVMMYHAMSAETFPLVREAGINVVQAYASQATLDAAQAAGVKVLAVLYPGMKPAGHPANIKNTIDTVTKYKDHPALFAWAVMDEPLYNSSDPFELLRISYKTIRDIDSKNPIFIVEDAGSQIEKTASYADTFTVDPYIGKHVDEKETRVSDKITQALVSPSILYQRPVYSLNQAFDWLDYWPDGNDYRHQVYQAFLAGARGIGFFSWDGARLPDGTKGSLYDSDLWEDMKAFAENELSDAALHFGQSLYPTLYEEKTDSVWQHSFVKDGKVHVIVLNRTKEVQSCTVRLESFDGKTKIAGGTVSAIGTNTVPSVGDGKMDITLAPSAAVKYVITPSGADFSALSESALLDLTAYPWARAQIETLAEKGIANTYSGIAYLPGTPITRADFAMFLVRTMGLSGEGDALFDDVSPDAYYAKEIALGRKAGILNGIGDNLYNPEGYITRQDLMTIVSRGLSLSGSADLTVYPDSGLVAEYAAAHVAAMIAAGLIKGNADGTLNPLGNTTRAEAAVIMDRIMGM